MHTPQSRVSAEAIEVAARLKKLVAFIDGPGFSALSAAHRDLLVLQRGAMDNLLKILSMRITAFKAEGTQPDETSTAAPVTHDPAKVIEPTVGRKVWYWPSDSDVQADGMTTMPGDPADATIIAVHGTRCVNLYVIDAMGQVYVKPSCLLIQPGDETPPAGGFAAWMPYQVGQASKAR